ncbi:MAG: hypothetical protein GY909_09225 [Oligoflexia bacterium]|nr:hypothetical protein [Oligoflexia bacterium]
MIVGLLGAGKTGSKVQEICHEQNLSCTVFNTSNPITVEKLQTCDVLVSFLPGPAFLEVLPMIVESAKPLVSGSTGIDLPQNLNLKAPWIIGHNFSLGMNLVHAMINILQKTNKLFDEFGLAIHEVHHTKKLDAPSGTALKWEKWSGNKAQITSERTGDVVGDHILSLNLDSETITLRHEAHDRRIFAKGALWAAHYLLKNNLSNDIHDFEQIAGKELL